MAIEELESGLQRAERQGEADFDSIVIDASEMARQTSEVTESIYHSLGNSLLQNPMKPTTTHSTREAGDWGVRSDPQAKNRTDQTRKDHRSPKKKPPRKKKEAQKKYEDRDLQRKIARTAKKNQG